jgi:hypothetical protein
MARDMSGLEWHNVRTKFRQDWSAGSEDERLVHTEIQTDSMTNYEFTLFSY